MRKEVKDGYPLGFKLFPVVSVGGYCPIQYPSPRTLSPQKEMIEYDASRADLLKGIVRPYR